MSSIKITENYSGQCQDRLTIEVNGIEIDIIANKDGVSVTGVKLESKGDPQEFSFDFEE